MAADLAPEPKMPNLTSNGTTGKLRAVSPKRFPPRHSLRVFARIDERPFPRVKTSSPFGELMINTKEAVQRKPHWRPVDCESCEAAYDPET